MSMLFQLGVSVHISVSTFEEWNMDAPFWGWEKNPDILVS